MTNILTSIAVSLAVASTPAPQAPVAKAADKAPAKASEVKYCLTVEAGTGSRLVRSECRTRAQWARLGVNVDKPSES
jgi:hypothetical protein